MCTGVEIAMAAVGAALSLVDTVSQIGSAKFSGGGSGGGL